MNNNATDSRLQPIPWSELPAWAERTASLHDPVRRDLQFFMLFTGLRAADACAVRTDQLDYDATLLQRPGVRGGCGRAVELPLPMAITMLVIHRRIGNEIEFGEGCPWLFPRVDERGDLVYVQECGGPRPSAGARGAGPHGVERLRDTFATAAHECGVHPLDLKCLLSPDLAAEGNGAGGHVRPSLDHLAESIERIAEFLEDRMGRAGQEALGVNLY